MDSRELEELLAAVAGGDLDSFEELYRRVVPRVLAFLRVRLRSGTDREGVVSDVMLEVWRRARSFRGRSAVMTWIFGIAHHKMIDRVRKLERRREDPLDEGWARRIEEPPTPATRPELALARREAGRAVRDCLQTLSDDHRAVLHLAFFEGQGYREIAEIMGSPLGTVRSRMHHAKLHLRDCLERRPEGAPGGGADDAD